MQRSGARPAGAQLTGNVHEIVATRLPIISAPATKACSVHFDAGLRDEHGLYLRHGGTPSPQRGEGGGEGKRTLESLYPLPPPLSLREREPAVLAGCPCLHSTETCSSLITGIAAAVR